MSKFLLIKGSILFISFDDPRQVLRYKLSEDCSLDYSTLDGMGCRHRIIDLNTDQDNNVYALDENGWFYKLETNEYGFDEFVKKEELPCCR